MNKTTVDGLVEQWVRPQLRALKAYHVPDATGMVKLDAMENPYRWPDALLPGWYERLATVSLNRYPDPQSTPLKQRLRSVFGVPEGAGVLLGNGSDEIIQLIIMALSGSGRKVMAPQPTFSMYYMISTFVGVDYVEVPLRADDFSLDVQAMLGAIEREQPAVIFLSYPNNPTGNLFDNDALRAIVEAAPGLVVIDEAYHAFAESTWLGEVGNYPNLLVLRTLSKLGLAGLRLGWVCGDPQWLNELDKIRLPYNINVLTQETADYALANYPILDQQTTLLRAERVALSDGLAKLPGVTVFSSAANFILFRVPQGRTATLFEGLKAQQVLIKNMHPAAAQLHDCLRVTVGTPDENQRFLAVLKTLI